MLPQRSEEGGGEDTPWVTASAVAQAAYCPYQLYLASAGVAPDAAGRRVLADGADDHRRWTRARRMTERRRRGALAFAVIALLAVLVGLAFALAGGLPSP